MRRVFGSLLGPGLRSCRIRGGRKRLCDRDDLISTVSLRDDIRSHRAEILRIARSYGASHVRVFGSVARGSEREDSDIDLLVTTNESTIFDLAAMEEELERLLGRRVQVVSDRGLKSSMRDGILREAVEV